MDNHKIVAMAAIFLLASGCTQVTTNKQSYRDSTTKEDVSTLDEMYQQDTAEDSETRDYDDVVFRDELHGKRDFVLADEATAQDTIYDENLDTGDQTAEDVAICLPATCEQLGYECGQATDGCGGTLKCGGCDQGQVCKGHKCVCQPRTCQGLGYECGQATDGCGGTLKCGGCDQGQVCQGHKCVCQPRTCQGLGYECGQATDGCGGTLKCGGCDQGQVCVLGKCQKNPEQQYRGTIVVGNSVQKVSRKFFGGNALFWIETDSTRNNPNYIKALQNARISMLRYPGGEVADNFDWETNQLNDPNHYPYSPNPTEDAKTRMDFDEFVKWKNTIGAGAILVVNLEEGFIEGDVQKAAQKAADWVRYANVKHKYKIKYWEIGNESYMPGTRYPLTSQEYADALKLFSEAMKKVDPTIMIGAIGPWDYKQVAAIDYLPKDLQEQLRSLKSPQERRAFANKYVPIYRNQGDPKDPWWTVISRKHDYFDFAVIHRYTGLRKDDQDLTKPLNCAEPVIDLRKFLLNATGVNYPIALTEYNVCNQCKNLSTIGLDLTLTEMIGDYLKAGVQIANYWPVRLKDARALFGLDDMSIKPTYYVFKGFSNYIGASILKTTSDNTMVYVIASNNPNQHKMTIFIVNKQDATAGITLKLPGKVQPVVSFAINKNNLKLHLLKRYPNSVFARQWNLQTAPLSVTIFRFNTN